MSGELYGFVIECESCGEDHQKIHVWESVSGTLRINCLNHPKPFEVFVQALSACREDREVETAA